VPASVSTHVCTYRNAAQPARAGHPAAGVLARVRPQDATIALETHVRQLDDMRFWPRHSDSMAPTRRKRHDRHLVVGNQRIEWRQLARGVRGSRQHHRGVEPHVACPSACDRLDADPTQHAHRVRLGLAVGQPNREARVFGDQPELTRHLDLEPRRAGRGILDAVGRGRLLRGHIRHIACRLRSWPQISLARLGWFREIREVDDLRLDRIGAADLARPCVQRQPAIEPGAR